MVEISAEAGRTKAGSATRPATNSRLFMASSAIAVFPDSNLLESEQPGGIVDEDAFAHPCIRRPFTEQVVQLNCAYAVVARQMRKIAAPDQLIQHFCYKSLCDRFHIHEVRLGVICIPV